MRASGGWRPFAAAAGALAALFAAAPAAPELPFEEVGRVEQLASPGGPHRVWVADPLLRRNALVDLDRGKLLGMISSGFGIPSGLYARSRAEIYVPETYYSRGSRGLRSDVLTIYDAVTLAPTGEVALPPKRAIYAFAAGSAALTDDDRFAAIFNLTPATSVSVVDVERRVLVEEVPSAGCSLVYAAGRRRIAMLCGDGALLVLVLDEQGRAVSKERSKPFFDPDEDPVTEKPVRWGDKWIFVTFEGMVKTVDFSGAEPRFEEAWSLLGEDDREDSWRIGGGQHLAVHEATGRLYSLVHQGGADTHKHPGTELWVYDLEQRKRLLRIALENPGMTFLGVPLAFDDLVWPLPGLVGWAHRRVPELGIDSLVVTRDDEPLLVTSSPFSGGLGIYDALSGEFLRRVYSGNFTNAALQLPAPRRASP